MMNFIEEYQVSNESVEALLDFWETNKTTATPGRTLGKTGSVVDSSVKESMDLELIPDSFPASLEVYAKDLGHAMGQYKEKYPYCDKEQQPWLIREHLIIQHYEAGGGYKVFHCENDGRSVENIQRHLVFMTYLNTIPPEEGGGTEFFYQGSYNAVAGKTLIWPATWTHTHKGIISPTREKKIITGWYSYDTFI
jgi:hypothetical protein